MELLGDLVTGQSSADELELRAADDIAPSPALPDLLTDVEVPTPDEAVTTRTFELGGRSRINGQKKKWT